MFQRVAHEQSAWREFGFTRPLQYYFASGLLSAVLDNAPTYLNFLKLAEVCLEQR